MITKYIQKKLKFQNLEMITPHQVGDKMPIRQFNPSLSVFSFFLQNSQHKQGLGLSPVLENLQKWREIF